MATLNWVGKKAVVGHDDKDRSSIRGEPVDRYGRQSNKIALYGRREIAWQSLYGSENGLSSTRKQTFGMAAAFPFARHSGFLLAKEEGSLVRRWVFLARLSALLPDSQKQRALLEREGCR